MESMTCPRSRRIFGDDAAGELSVAGFSVKLDDVQFVAGGVSRQAPGSKPTVSTTSVSPSQRPIE